MPATESTRYGQRAVRRGCRGERAGTRSWKRLPRRSRAGYAATSLDEVAREAGVSRTILYRYFESKADLYWRCPHSAVPAAGRQRPTAKANAVSGRSRSKS
jgi:hypothetical protein